MKIFRVGYEVCISFALMVRWFATFSKYKILSTHPPTLDKIVGSIDELIEAFDKYGSISQD